MSFQTSGVNQSLLLLLLLWASLWESQPAPVDAEPGCSFHAKQEFRPAALVATQWCMERRIKFHFFPVHRNHDDANRKPLRLTSKQAENNNGRLDSLGRDSHPPEQKSDHGPSPSQELSSYRWCDLFDVAQKGIGWISVAYIWSHNGCKVFTNQFQRTPHRALSVWENLRNTTPKWMKCLKCWRSLNCLRESARGCSSWV